MRIREENCNMILLAAVALCCFVIAGTVALFEPTQAQIGQAGIGQAQIGENRVAHNRPLHVVDQAPVRVIGAPFVPNVNPRER